MKVHFLGHAGLYIETGSVRILCDPFVNPAYFGSWWPFPANDDLEWSAFRHPTHLYISHMHQDHLDREFLRTQVDKSATVLLPDYPLPDLRSTLASLGFHHFYTPPNGTLTRLETETDDEVSVAIWSMSTPSDGPLGDSILMVEDRDTRILNLNDARPRDLQALTRTGPLDGLFLQYSGAIWYPLAYDFPAAERARLGHQKRVGEMTRATTYIKMLKPRAVFPCAGPPAFLDPDLFDWNDLGDENNPFPDQRVFLRWLDDHDIHQGHLVLPGSTIQWERGRDAEVNHPLPPKTVDNLFSPSGKSAYLRRYQAKSMDRLLAERTGWPEAGPDLFAKLKAKLDPPMAACDLIARQINADVVLDWGENGARLDFRHRRIEPWDKSPARYYFKVEPNVLAACIHEQLDDWVNALFLSCRFQARREGGYNEAVYTFFKCLSPERIQYAEGCWMEENAPQELWRCGDYLVQRRCPHLKADLTRFGVLDDNNILTCQVHGWRFDLATGRALNADNRHIYRRRIPEQPESDGGME